MIISHKYKFIFFAIPKTGTHSIRFALRPHLGENDEEHVDLFYKSKFDIPEFKNRKNGHFSVREIRPYISDEIWNSYFKFTFVRNPIDRFISAIFFKNKSLQVHPELAQVFMKKFIERDKVRNNLFYKPQIEYLIDDNGKNCLDFIGKTETMQEDFDTICQKLKLPSCLLDIRNTSNHKQYDEYCDVDLLSQIKEIYSRDLKFLKY